MKGRESWLGCEGGKPERYYPAVRWWADLPMKMRRKVLLPDTVHCPDANFGDMSAVLRASYLSLEFLDPDEIADALGYPWTADKVAIARWRMAQRVYQAWEKRAA